MVFGSLGASKTPVRWRVKNSCSRQSLSAFARRSKRLPLIPSTALKSLCLGTLADAKYVPVRMPHVHLADVPRHVGRRESNFYLGGHALSVDLVNVLHPHGHPHALVGRFVPAGSKCGTVRSLAPTALASLAEKDFAFT
jgi:hypothetical protein